MANKCFVVVEVTAEIAATEIGKTVTLTGVTGNPSGVVKGKQVFVDDNVITGTKTVSAKFNNVAVPLDLTFT